MMSPNLRREARLDARIDALVVRGRRLIPVETSDVSFKGLFLRTTESLALRSLTRLRLMLPIRQIEAHAMVVHVADENDPRGPGVGVEFWGLAGPDRTAWDDFVRHLMHQSRSNATANANANAKPAARTDEVDRPTPSGIRISPRLPMHYVSRDVAR